MPRPSWTRRSAAEEMLAAGYRISKILEDIGNLSGRTKREPRPIYVNDLAIESSYFGRELTVDLRLPPTSS